MTDEQIQAYEELRDVKQELELLIDAMENHEEFEGFAAVLVLKNPVCELAKERFYRYATSKYLIDNIRMFLKAELSRVKHLIERI